MVFVLDLILSYNPVEDLEGHHRSRTAGLGYKLLDKDCATGNGLGTDLGTGYRV